jgi:hypothetical protein
MAKWDLGKLDSASDDRLAIIKRIRRKVEVMRLDQKAANSLRHHDSNEILSLLDMLERNLGGKP